MWIVWIGEYVRPTECEDENRHAESRANAVACYELALIEGITKAEIDEEYPDLVSHFAQVHVQMLAQEVAHKAGKGG